MNKAIYFKGENCGVCQQLYPKVLAHFKAKYPALEFETVEVQKNPELAAQHGVFTIPVLVVLFEGKEHFRFVRNFATRDIDEKLERTYGLMFG